MSMILRDCPYCGAGSSTLTLAGATRHPANTFTHRAFFTCNRCGNPFAALVSKTENDNDPSKVSGDLERWGFGIDSLTPAIRRPRAPNFTPEATAKRFEEAEDSFNRRKWTSAVSMYRSTLDIATKDVAKSASLQAVEKLYARIESLAAAHVITEAMRDWAHEVRGTGNDALHDEQEMTEEDAVQMRLFTETFLRYAYELPGEVAARKQQKKAVP